MPHLLTDFNELNAEGNNRQTTDTFQGTIHKVRATFTYCNLVHLDVSWSPLVSARGGRLVDPVGGDAPPSGG
jgi:hypothetical protein